MQHAIIRLSKDPLLLVCLKDRWTAQCSKKRALRNTRSLRSFLEMVFFDTRTKAVITHSLMDAQVNPEHQKICTSNGHGCNCVLSVDKIMCKVFHV